MTRGEKLDITGPRVSIGGLFLGERPAANMQAGMELGEVIENILRPGLPAMTALGLEQSADRLRAYIDEVARTDIRRLADVRHEPNVDRRTSAHPLSMVVGMGTISAVNPDRKGQPRPACHLNEWYWG